MSIHFRDVAAKAAADGAITAEELLALRRSGWANGTITPDEAEALFVANDAIADPTVEWSDFFVEAGCVFLVEHVEPKGYVSEENAAWLMARIDRDGRIDSMTELELLVRLFERAQNVPDSLREYALKQVESAVLTGEGPTRKGGMLEAGNVTAAEARMMRRIVFSSGSERPAAVSKGEAEMLYRIKDATLSANNAPEWKRLFVQGVGNYLMGFVRYTDLSHERAAELEAFMQDHSSSVGGFFSRIGKAAVKRNFFDALGDVFGGEASGHGDADKAALARDVDKREQVWLEDKLDGNGQIDEYDRALLEFLNEESGYKR